jgi:hypothetical protein
MRHLGAVGCERWARLRTVRLVSGDKLVAIGWARASRPHAPREVIRQQPAAPPGGPRPANNHFPLLLLAYRSC